MDDICVVARQCLAWLDQSRPPRVLFAGMNRVLQFANLPAPHLEVCFFEAGSVEELCVGPLEVSVPECSISVLNVHFGNQSPPKAERGLAWCLVLDASGVPEPLAYVAQRPVFASVAVKRPLGVIDVFRRLRGLCVRQQPFPEDYDPAVVMYDASGPLGDEGRAWRLKGLLLELFSLILDAGADRSADSRALSEPISRSLALIEDRFTDPQLGLPELAQTACLSVAHFGRLFTAQVGRAPMAYIQHLRLREASLLLRQTGQRIEQIADAVGYSDPLYFSRLFGRAYGQSPRAFRLSRNDWSGGSSRLTR